MQSASSRAGHAFEVAPIAEVLRTIESDFMELAVTMIPGSDTATSWRNSSISYRALESCAARIPNRGKTWLAMTVRSSGKAAFRTGFHCSTPQSSASRILISTRPARILALHLSVPCWTREQSHKKPPPAAPRHHRLLD
jgi:hypothetical protein